MTEADRRDPGKGRSPAASELSGPAIPEAVEEALERHREQVAEVLPSGDPGAIKRLYVELGDLLESAVADAPGDTPVLSLPETAPVVLGLLDGVHGRILDAGCGPNPAVSIELGRDADKTVVALDIGLGTVRLARSIAEQAGVRLLAVVADVEALPFADGAFAGSVCDDTIEHLPNDRLGAAELSRVMAPGGRAVIATPNRLSLEVLWRKGADRLRGRSQPASAYYAASSHLREYTWTGLDRVLHPSFRVLQRASVGWGGGWKRRLATRMTSRPPLRSFSRMIVVAAEPRR